MSTITTRVLPVNAQSWQQKQRQIEEARVKDWAGPFSGVNLPSGRESQS